MLLKAQEWADNKTEAREMPKSIPGVFGRVATSGHPPPAEFSITYQTVKNKIAVHFD